MTATNDPEFATNLSKAAKGKAHYFALVVKGSDILLALNKKPIKGGAIKEMKRELGGKAVYSGICQGVDGDLQFRSTDEMPSKLEKAIRTFAKDNAGKSVKPVFVLVSNLKDIGADEDEDDDKAGPSAEALAHIKVLGATVGDFDKARKASAAAIKAEHRRFAAIKEAAKDAQARNKAGDRAAGDTVKLAKAYVETFGKLLDSHKTADASLMVERKALDAASDKRAKADPLKAVPPARVASFEKSVKAASDDVEKQIKMLQKIAKAMGV